MKYKVMIVEDQICPASCLNCGFRHRSASSWRSPSTTPRWRTCTACAFPVDLILMDVVTRDGESGLDAAERIKRRLSADQNHHRDLHAGMLLPEPRAGDRRGELLVQGGAARKPAGRDGTHDGGESVYPDATPELQLGLASSYQFTNRELEVLREMTGGDTNQEIAERLHMSVATVKTHILNMLEKTASETAPSWPCARGKAGW